MTHTRTTSRHAFTLIELLVVITILGLLIAALGVAFSGALTAGKRSQTEQTMRNMSVAIEQFRNDFGFYPPLLDDDPQRLGVAADRLTVPRGRFNPADAEASLADADNRLAERRWHSIFSLPIYLAGVGSVAPYDEALDRMNPARHDGVAGPGLRDPGRDRSWGGASDRTLHQAPSGGRAYGPYMDIDNSRNFRAVGVDDFRFADTLPVYDEDEDQLFVFTDAWGLPIRYYQRWPASVQLETDGPATPSLDWTPLELINAEALRFEGGPDGLTVNVGADNDLTRVSYALLSSGADELFGERVDEDTATPSEPLLFGRDFAELDREQQLLLHAEAGEPGWLDDNVRILP